RIIEARDVRLEFNTLLLVRLADELQRIASSLEPLPEERVVRIACKLDRRGFAISRRAARISEHENEVVVFQAADTYREELLNLHRDITRRIRGGRAIRRSVRPQESEIAGVACPFEVVRVAAVHADVTRRCVYDADVFDLLGLVQVIKESVVQHLNADLGAGWSFRFFSRLKIVSVLLNCRGERVTCEFSRALFVLC